MGFLEFSKPKWQHSDPAIRLEAVRALPADRLDTFTKIALEDPDELIRSSALLRITDLDILEEIVRGSRNETNKKQAQAAVDNLLYRMAMTSGADQAVPVEKIADLELLAGLAAKAEHPEIRIRAVGRIDDQILLGRILEQECGRKTALAALAKITDEALLRRLTEHGGSKKIQAMAAQKLETLTGTDREEKTTARNDQPERLAELTATAEKIAGSLSWELARSRMAELHDEWTRLDPDGLHPAKPAFDKACQHFSRRYETELHRRDEENQRRQQQEKLRADCETVCARIETLDIKAGAQAEQAFQEARRSWPLNDPSADNSLFPVVSRFRKACTTFEQQRETLRAEQTLLDELNSQLESAETLTGSDPQGGTAALRRLEKRLADSSFALLDQTAIVQRIATIRSALDKATAEENQRRLAAGLLERQQLIAALEALRNSEHHAEAENACLKLKERWDQLPPLPAAETAGLDEQFRTLFSRFLEQQEAFFKKQEWQRWHNKTMKEELIRTVEALSEEKDLVQAAMIIREAQKRWKEIGPVPQKDSDRLWQRFHETCNRNYERCQQFFAGLDEQRNKNQIMKEELCRRAEAIVESSDWKTAAETLRTLQQEWSVAGPAPREQDAELNRVFRRTCNNFYERRRRHFAETDLTRRAILTAKAELCRQAEALADNPSFETSKEIRALQKKWKNAGTGPRPQEQTTWERFRTACDRFYAGLDKKRLDNLQRKIELCELVEHLLNEPGEKQNQNELAHRLGELQKEWKVIGPVPREESEAIWERFHRPCDHFFAGRRELLAAEEAEREKNRLRKEALIARAEEIVARDQDGSAGAEMQKLQQEWIKAGRATQDSEAELHRRFRVVCDGYFKHRRQQIATLEQDRLKNLKSKETLCFRLEQLLGLPPVQELKEYSTLTLAEEFKIARETKFIMAGKEDDHQRKAEEVRRIQEEWRSIGPVPRESSRTIVQHYRSLLDRFHGGQRRSDLPPKPLPTNAPKNPAARATEDQ